jgi:hypothetical protein
MISGFPEAGSADQEHKTIPKKSDRILFLRIELTENFSNLEPPFLRLFSQKPEGLTPQKQKRGIFRSFQLSTPAAKSRVLGLDDLLAANQL